MRKIAFTYHLFHSLRCSRHSLWCVQSSGPLPTCVGGCAPVRSLVLSSDVGVDPRAWTPEYWERPAPDEESTCREADRLTRPSFERKRLNLFVLEPRVSAS